MAEQQQPDGVHTSGAVWCEKQRFGRYGPVVLRADVNTYAYADTNTYAYASTHAYADTNTCAYAYASTDADTDTYADAYAYAGTGSHLLQRHGCTRAGFEPRSSGGLHEPAGSAGILHEWQHSAELVGRSLYPRVAWRNCGKHGRG